MVWQFSICADCGLLISPLSYWWMSERAQTELELIRLAYAELLYRWKLDHDRIQVLKLCRSGNLNKRGGTQFNRTILLQGNGFGGSHGIGQYWICTFTTSSKLISRYVDLTRSCATCSAALIAPYLSCSACHIRQKPVLCVICHLPVLSTHSPAMEML